MQSERASRLLLRGVLPALGLAVLELSRRRHRAAGAMRDRLAAAEELHVQALSTRLHAERERIAADVRERVRAEIDTLTALGLEIERLIALRDAAVVEGRLDAVGTVSREALDALRRLLDEAGPPPAGGAARDRRDREDPPADHAPAERIERLAQPGQPVTVRHRGDAALSSPRQTLAAARVVESVLGVAPGTGAVGVLLHHRPGALELTVRGRGAGPPPLSDPAALAALRELGRLNGGVVRIGGGSWRWRVRASLPSSAAVDGPRRDGPRRWEPATADAVLALAATALVLVDVAVLGVQRPRTSALLGAATASGPLAVRRRFPLAVCALAGVGLVAGAALDALPSGPAPAYFIITVVPFSAAAHASTARRAVLGVALTTTGAVASEAVRARRAAAQTDRVTMALYGAVAGALAWGARHHHGRALALSAGEEQLRLRYPAVLQEALAAQRDGVARDLHDVVAHGLTLVAVVASAARAHVARGRWVAAEGSAQALRAAAAETAVELRRLLRTLEAGRASAHRLADLEHLAEQARRSGHAVTLHWQASPETPLGGAHAALAYRCVQEALSNVRRHAAAAPTAVTVRNGGGALVVEVVNAPPTRPAPARGITGPSTGTGRGLAAMQQRARELGATAEAGPDPAGGFRVALRLPPPGAQPGTRTRAGARG